MTAFDLLLLAFKAVTIASIPLALVYVGRATRHGGDRLRRLAWVTTFITFDLIVFGGFTRLTDSGLGCPDWPGCYAKANPLAAAEAIHGAEALAPTGPVTMAKAWIEMIHRYLAMAVGLLIIAMLVWSVLRWRARRRSRTTSSAAFPGATAGLLALVVVQGAFGAWTVTQRLQPIFVSIHLLLGNALLAALVWHALRFERLGPDRRTSPGPVGLPSGGLRAFALVGALVLTAQIALGGWVSSNYAVLACSDFPTCHGQWIPPMDFAAGFQLWRPLGRTAAGDFLPAEALTAIHWLHRNFAVVVVLVFGSLAWRVRRLDGLRASAKAIGLLLVAQALTGTINVVFAWPLVAAVLHNAGAAGLVVATVVINYRLATGTGTLVPASAAAPSLSVARLQSVRGARS